MLLNLRILVKRFVKMQNYLNLLGLSCRGHATYRQVDGFVIASFEGFSNDHANLKINTKGWLNNFNQISSGPNVLYKQTPLESGRVIWDDKQGWYKCVY